MSAQPPAETWPLLARFSGLDYLSPFVLNASRVNEIRGVNWLTILGDPMRAQMGELDGLRRILSRAEDDLHGSAPTGRNGTIWPSTFISTTAA